MDRQMDGDDNNIPDAFSEKRGDNDLLPFGSNFFFLLEKIPFRRD